MLILKYILLFCIFSGVALIGNLISKKYRNRVENLINFKKSYNILESKIKFTYEPLGEIFNEISNIIRDNTIQQVFKNTSTYMKNNDFKTSWQKAIEENKTNLSLNEQDIKTIKGLGNILGKTDVEGQISEIELNLNLIDTQITEAEKELRKNEKMYRSLGTIVGLAIVVILI